MRVPKSAVAEVEAVVRKYRILERLKKSQEESLQAQKDLEEMGVVLSGTAIATLAPNSN
jgi:hypothetical protein